MASGEEGQRWDHLRRALTDHDLSLNLRTAAALMLLCGVVFSRIQQLRRDEVERHSDGVHLARARATALITLLEDVPPRCSPAFSDCTRPPPNARPATPSQTGARTSMHES